MDCDILKDLKKEDHLYYNIQAIEICKKVECILLIPQVKIYRMTI